MPEPHHYMATGALSNQRVMETLLGRLPDSYAAEIGGFSLGLVRGSVLNRNERFNVVPDDFVTRVLVRNPAEYVAARIYSNVRRLEIDRINMFTLEGMATQIATIPLGDARESVGEAFFHVKKNGVLHEELAPEDREVFPNGLEATILAAEQARIRFEEKFQGPSPERR